ncbi:MAG: N-acetylglucosamine-6-phosphate deacetylase [Anaerolineales bacterium]|nr:N-acetylglucosamine-6-phosphate deacetylase [Anaerolineales bacterium]
MRYIAHAIVYTQDEIIDDGAILIDERRIIAVGHTAALTVPEGAEVMDAAGLIVAPGFIDLQINGAFGDDFTVAPDTIWRVAAKMPRWGVTSFLPTIITSPRSQVTWAQEVLDGGPPAGWQGTMPLGLHVEGPFLNPQKKGAHNPDHLRLPTMAHIEGWAPRQHVRLVTLAPELAGAHPVIDALINRGVVVSAGHSMATYAQAQSGFQAGIRYGTHLFNAMPPLEHREPGLAGALLTAPALVVGLIPDGVHTHPAIVSLVWTAKGARGLTLVTDAMAALGNAPGRYLLCDQEVIVTDVDARLPSGTLAGSILSMDEALRRFIQYTGCTLQAALPTITSTPADVLGIGAERGRIQPGAYADLVFLDHQLAVQRTMVEGALVFDVQS